MTDSTPVPPKPQGKKPTAPAEPAGFPPPPPPEACERMLKELPAEPSNDDVRRLVSALATERWSLRERISSRLAALGRPVVPVLLEMLGSGLWYSRAATLRALGRIHDPSALLSVIEACGDENQTVSEEAAKALVAYCRSGHALAVAKILHARGPVARDDMRMQIEAVDRDAARRLERLWGEKQLMGAESRLQAAEEVAIAAHVRDEDWNFGWDDLVPSEPLAIEKKSVLERLRDAGLPGFKKPVGGEDG